MDGARTLVDRTVLVRSERVLGLSVDEDREPVAAGEELTYVLTYGNRSSTTTTSTEMRLPLPAGTSFVAASGGGFLSGGEVVWSLGSLIGHEGGRREVTVLVDGGLDEGALLDVNAATLTGESSFLLHQAHTRAMTRVEGATRFDVSVTVNPDPPRPGETLRAELTVTNTSAVDFLFGTVLRLSYPAGLFSVGDSLLTDGGDCPNTSCDVSETVVWNLGTLHEGGRREVTVELGGALAAGTLLEVDARRLGYVWQSGRDERAARQRHPRRGPRRARQYRHLQRRLRERQHVGLVGQGAVGVSGRGRQRGLARPRSCRPR